MNYQLIILFEIYVIKHCFLGIMFNLDYLTHCCVGLTQLCTELGCC
jgi:hypothetical protein